MDYIMKSGDSFIATVGSKRICGKIRIEDSCVYLCQDEMDGSMCRDRFGYKFSWYISDVIYFERAISCHDEFKDFEFIEIIHGRKNRIEKLNL